MQQFAVVAQASGNNSGAAAAAAAAPPATSPLRLRPQRRDQVSKEAAMADVDEHQELTRAFSGLGGLGVDETAVLSALGRWRQQPEKRAQFRRGFPAFFSASGVGGIERCEDEYVRRLKTEFSRFKNAAVLWAMHPWERDARWAHHVLHKAHPAAIVVEVACTRSAADLLGARRAYHALYHRSLEEDVASRAKAAPYSHLLLGLVTAYRYEGPRVSEELAREEAKALADAVRSPARPPLTLLQNELVVRVLTTRSKPQLRATFRLYKELHGGKPLEEDLAGEPCLQETVRCIDSPASYFSEVIGMAFRDGADKQAKAALTRVVVSRSDEDMEEIKEAYARRNGGAKLVDAVAKNAHGHYKDALLAMIGK